MIKEKQKLSGNLSTKGLLSGSLSNSVIYVDPITQEKEVVPTRETQEIIPDTGYTGLSKVKVNGYIPNTASKIISSNGTYKAENDNLDGYNEVNVQVSIISLDDYFTSTIGVGNKTVSYPYNSYLTSGWIKCIKKIRNVQLEDPTNMNYMFSYYGLSELPSVDTSNVTKAYSAFSYIEKEIEIPQYNFSKLQDARGMFNYSSGIVSISQLNFDSATDLRSIFSHTNNLTNFGGLKNYGKGFSKVSSAYNSYTLNLMSCTKLTHDSLMNVINSLYDIASASVFPQNLVLGTTNIAKLTENEIAIATSKGWTVS